MRVPQGILVAVAAAALGVGVGFGEIVDDGTGFAEGESVAAGLEVFDVPGSGTHAASPSATVAASATAITVDRSRESAMVFIV